MFLARHLGHRQLFGLTGMSGLPETPFGLLFRIPSQGVEREIFDGFANVMFVLEAVDV